MKKVAENIMTSVKGAVPSIIKPMSAFIVPYLPDKLLSQYLNGKMTLSSLKNNEDIFDEINANLKKTLTEYQEKLIDKNDPFSAIQLAENVRLIENHIRYTETIRLSLSHLHVTEDDTVNSDQTQHSSPTWFDMFREIAMRRCEGWRRDLLARCAALEEEQPGSITLKTLWNIGILETDSFLSMSLFFDCSVYLDDYPVIFLDRDDLMKTVQVSSGEFESVLIQVLTGLMDDGLLSFGEFELSTEEDILVESQDSILYLNNDQQSENNKTYIRLEGYTCTDIGLELCKLYEPEFNEVSKFNMECFTDLINEADGINLYKQNN